MEIGDLKKNMSVLQQVLAKSNGEIKIDITESETAQTKLVKTNKKNVRNCLLASIIPCVLLITGYNTEYFPLYLKIFLLLYLLFGAGWYVFLWNITKKLNVITLTPAAFFSATSKLKLYTVAGEIFFTIGLTVFFSLLLPNLWNFHLLSFWLIIGILMIGITFTLTFYLPKLIRIFRDFESIK